MANKLLVLLILLLTPAFADAAAFTSKAAGSWSASGQTTWNESGVPGDGDTATVNHAVTVTTTCTVGTSGSTGTTAITLGSAGSLVITGELVCKGDIAITGSGTAADKLWVQRGGTLTMNAGSGVNYLIQLGTGSAQRPRMRVGDAGTGRATVRKTGSGTAQIMAQYANTTRGGLYGNDCDFEDLGSTGSTNAILILGTNSDDIFKLDNCTFDGCGRVGTGGYFLDAGVTCSFTDCTWTDSLDTRSVSISAGDADVRFTRCSLDGQLYLIAPAGVAVNDCYLGGDVTGTEGYFTVDDSVIRKTGSGGSATSIYGNLNANYMLWDGTATNPHGWASLANRDIAWTDNTVEYTGSDDTGDLFQVTNPASPRTYTYEGNLLLPATGSGGNPGSFLSLSAAGANLSVIVRHNTWASNNSSSPPETGVKFGESYGGHAGMVQRLQSNLAYGTASATGLKLQRMSTSTVQNVVSAANCTHNGGYNLADGSEYGDTPGASARGYNASDTSNALITSGQLGANDVDADPQFVDSSRNVATWYTAGLGNATTGTTAGDRAAALAILAADPTQIVVMRDWVREGWSPQNAVYEGAAHDGGTIGAMPLFVDEGGGGGAIDPLGGGPIP